MSTTWAAVLYVEAMRFWFCSLILSILVGMVELWSLHGQDVVFGKGGELKGEKSEESATNRKDSLTRERDLKRKKIMKKLVIDGCDLLIPGSTTGWIVASSATVGMLSVVSTVLAGVDIWSRIRDS